MSGSIKRVANKVLGVSKGIGPQPQESWGGMRRCKDIGSCQTQKIEKPLKSTREIRGRLKILVKLE